MRVRMCVRLVDNIYFIILPLVRRVRRKSVSPLCNQTSESEMKWKKRKRKEKKGNEMNTKREENSILVPILFIFSSCFNSTFIPHHFYKMHTVVYYFTRRYCYTVTVAVAVAVTLTVTMLVLFMNIFCYFILHVFSFFPSSLLISCCFHVAFALAVALHFSHCFR